MKLAWNYFEAVLIWILGFEVGFWCESENIELKWSECEDSKAERHLPKAERHLIKAERHLAKAELLILFFFFFPRLFLFTFTILFLISSTRPHRLSTKKETTWDSQLEIIRRQLMESISNAFTLSRTIRGVKCTLASPEISSRDTHLIMLWMRLASIWRTEANAMLNAFMCLDRELLSFLTTSRIILGVKWRVWELRIRDFDLSIDLSSLMVRWRFEGDFVFGIWVQASRIVFKDHFVFWIWVLASRIVFEYHFLFQIWVLASRIVF